MAKKKKSSKRSADESASKSAKKVRKSQQDSVSGSELPIFKHVAKKKLSTGKGATPADIGRSLVELYNSGRADDVKKLWHHKKIESIERDGSVFLGRKGIDEKDEWWYGAFEMHSAKADGPYIGATGFAVHFVIEISPKHGDGAGQRTTMREIGVYTVSKGKIVREEFMGC